MQIIEPLRIPAVARLWTGLSLSAVGDQLQRMAIIWLSARLLGAQSGFITAAEGVVTIAVALFGGALADAWDMRRTMIAADLARALVALIPVVAAIAGHLGAAALLAATLGLAALRAVFDPALEACLPRLVTERGLLTSTNALMDATARVARLVGPSLAGLLAAVVPVVGLMAANALTFVASAAALRSLRRELPVLAAPAHDSPRRRLDLLIAGFRAVAARPVFVYLLARGAIVNGLWVLSMWICLPLLIEQKQLTGFGLHGLGVIGLVMGCYGVGNVIGNLFVGSLRALRPLPMIFAGNVIVGAGLLGIALAASAAPAGAVVPLMMLLAAATAIGGPLSDVPLSTLRQTTFAPSQIAAVYRLSIVADWSGIVLATVCAPLLLGDRSPAGVMTLCGLGALAAVLAGHLAATWWTNRGGSATTAT